MSQRSNRLQQAINNNPEILNILLRGKFHSIKIDRNGKCDLILIEKGEYIHQTISSNTGSELNLEMLPPLAPKKTDEIETEHQRFKEYLVRHENHAIWTASQRKGRSPNSKISQKPEFDFGNVRGNCIQKWMIYTKTDKKKLNDAFIDFSALYKLGNPLLAQNKGGLRWEDIRDKIYNSGTLTLGSKKTNWDAKLNQQIFFPSGKTDNGRTISQFLYRLWWLVNNPNTV